MLSDILQSSRQRLERNSAAQKRAYEKEQYEALLSKIEESIKQVLILLDCAIAARDEIQVVCKLPDDLVEALYTPMSRISEQIVNGLPERSDALALEATVNSLSKKINALWSSQIRDRVVPTGSLLETFAQFSDDPDRMRQIAIRISANRDAIPRSKEAILHYKRTIEEADVQVRKLNADQEVQRFFQKVINNAATIDDITPKVDEWIRAHGLARKLRVLVQL